MNKDKAIKISIILIILFAIFGIFIVRAANTITLSVSSNAPSYVSSSSSKDTIKGSYFNGNDILVLNYTVLDGFSKIEDSAIKVRFTNMGNHDENMLNSCIKLLYPGEYVDTFQLAINYQNFLDYEERNIASGNLTGGDSTFPTNFSIELYTMMGKDEVSILTRDIEITTSKNTNNVSVELTPYDNTYVSITTPYSFLEPSEDGYNLDTIIGGWEDSKYYIFNYKLFDTSSPREDIKIASTNTDYVYLLAEDDDAPKGKAYLATKIGDIELHGLKLVIEFERENNEYIAPKTYAYELAFRDIYGEITTIPLTVQFMQYERFVYEEGVTDSSLLKNAVVKETSPSFKVSEDGNLDISMNTSFTFDGLSLLDGTFKDITSEHAGVTGYNNFKVYLNNIDTGRYTLLLYSTMNDDIPAASYSFYYEKGKVDVKDYIYVYGEKTELIDEDTNWDYQNEINISRSMDYVIIDRELTLNGRTINTEVNYEYGFDYGSEDSSSITGFDDNYSGLFAIDTTELYDYFVFSVSSSGITKSYVVKPNVGSIDDLKVNLYASTTTLKIPEKGERNSLILTPVITRNGTEIDIPYEYDYIKGDEFVSANDIYILNEGGQDILYIQPSITKGDYTIKISLKDYPDIANSVIIKVTDSSESSDNNISVEITNGSNIRIPDSGKRTDLEIKTRIIKNGSEITGNGTFEMVNSPTGVILNNNVLSVYSNATEGAVVVVNFTYEGISASKVFTLVKDASGEGTIIDDETPVPTFTPGEGDDGESKVFDSIVISGFDSDRSQVKVLTFDEPSGSSKTLRYRCYNENGVEISNPIIEISGSNESNGILVEPNYTNKTITVYANGLFSANKDFYITVTSNGESILNLPVVAARPDTWDCYIDFSTNTFAKNSSFKVTGSFYNYDDNEIEVSLVTLLYDKNNKIIQNLIDTKTVKSLEEAEFTNRLTLPSDINDIKIKSVFINGSDITKASRQFTYSRSITNRKEG